MVVQVQDRVNTADDADTMDVVELFDSEEDLAKYLPLGLNQDYDISYQFSPKDLVIVGAQRGHGKSFTCCNMAVNAAQQGRSVLYFTIEMDQRPILQRMASMSTGIPLGRLIKKKSVQTLVEELASSKLAILTEGGVTLLGHFIHKDGHYFSNSGYKNYITTYPSTYYSTKSVSNGSSTKRHDDELWTEEDEREWLAYNDPEGLYNTDMMLGIHKEHFCDSCGRSYVPDERKHDKLGDALWMICEKCIEIPVEEARV
mgnify:CR=1 FL=1